MSRPLVTQVLWTLGRAGAERMVVDLASLLGTRGFEVRVVAALRGGDMARDLMDAGIPFSVGPDTRDRRKTIAFMKGEFLLHRPALVHTHLGANVWAGLAATQMKIKPWVITAHSEKDFEAWPARLLHHWAYRRADRVACVSHAVEKFVRDTARVSENKLMVIPNGVDLRRLSARGSGPFQDVPRLVVAGRLVHGKNLSTLLHALVPIKRPWRLDVYGDGPMRGEWERLAAYLGLLARVHFYGVTADLSQVWPHADLFCFPTRSEGQGLSLYEAAGAGVPIVASDLPVFREAFGDGDITYVPSSDVSAWTQAIERELAAPKPFLEKALRAQAIVREQFTSDQMADRYSELYRQLLA